MTSRCDEQFPSTVQIASMKRSFVSTGVSAFRQMLSGEEIALLTKETERLWNTLNNRSSSNLRLGLRQDTVGEVVLDRIDPVEDVSDVFRELNDHPGLKAVANTLLGGPVTVMKEKLIYKRPGTSGFGLHRDVDYYQSTGLSGEEVVTAAVMIDEMTKDSGALVFYPDLRFRKTRAPDCDARDVDMSETNDLEPIVHELLPGDVLFFDGLVPHRSDFNRSLASRRIHYITYIPARYTDAREKYYAQRLSEQAEERRELVESELSFD